MGGWWWAGGAHNCTFCPSPRWILEITRLVAQMANIAGLLALVVAEIFDWLADMLVMGGYALEVIWLLCRIAVMIVLVLGKRFVIKIRLTFW